MRIGVEPRCSGVEQRLIEGHRTHSPAAPLWQGKGPKVWVPNSRSQVQVPKSGSQSLGPKLQVPKSRSQSLGPKVWVPKSGSQSLGPKLQVPKSGSQSLGPKLQPNHTKHTGHMGLLGPPSNAARRHRAWRRPWHRTPLCELSVWQTALDLRLFRLWRSAFAAWRPLPPSFCAHRLLTGPPAAIAPFYAPPPEPIGAKRVLSVWQTVDRNTAPRAECSPGPPQGQKNAPGPPRARQT